MVLLYQQQQYLVLAVNQYAYQQVYEAPNHQAKLSHELLGGKCHSLLLIIPMSAAFSRLCRSAWCCNYTFICLTASMTQSCIAVMMSNSKICVSAHENLTAQGLRHSLPWKHMSTRGGFLTIASSIHSAICVVSKRSEMVVACLLAFAPTTAMCTVLNGTMSNRVFCLLRANEGDPMSHPLAKEALAAIVGFEIGKTLQHRMLGSPTHCICS